jgi:hypothetical protein
MLVLQGCIKELEHSTCTLSCVPCVFAGNINLVPTDLRGLTFSRTPQQVRPSMMGCPPGGFATSTVQQYCCWVLLRLHLQMQD